MFYDERIEQAKGKIIRNAIIMSTVILAVISIMKIIMQNDIDNATFV